MSSKSLNQIILSRFQPEEQNFLKSSTSSGLERKLMGLSFLKNSYLKLFKELS